MELQNIVSKPLWSPRDLFPPSSELSYRLFACGGGLYLVTNPSHGPGDPVRAVGWAESDYWALRIWQHPQFTGSLDSPPSQWRPAPSMAFRGGPEDLSFGAVREFERAQLGSREARVVVVSYRKVDGAFLYSAIRGIDGTAYFYESNDPKPEAQPVAVEIELPEST